MFLDIATIYCKAGNGGNGKVSFHREKYVPNGGPDGGDGGRGGSIYVVGDNSTHTLIAFRYTQKFRAPAGDNGDTNNCVGKSGADIIIKMPCGTVIKDAETGGIIADVFEEGTKILLFAGGRGGRGNARFATSTRKAPAFSEFGESTEEHKLRLELKTIADVGLVGFPNVGKSTLLSVISAARPKIADYHFTTLKPNLGVVSVHEEAFVVADIPGLIEGAADGVGLGHAFLRHIERVRLIVHVLDISGYECRDPLEDYAIIRKELERYSPHLASLPEIIVANKTDLMDDDCDNIARLKAATGAEIVEISASTTAGTRKMCEIVHAKLKELPALEPLEFEKFEYAKVDKNEIKISKTTAGYYVSGGLVNDFARRVVLSDPESFRWFQKVLRDKGVIKALKAAGLQDGDVVQILDVEFEYFE